MLLYSLSSISEMHVVQVILVCMQIEWFLHYFKLLYYYLSKLLMLYDSAYLFRYIRSDIYNYRVFFLEWQCHIIITNASDLNTDHVTLGNHLNISASLQKVVANNRFSKTMHILKYYFSYKYTNILFFTYSISVQIINESSIKIYSHLTIIYTCMQKKSDY